MQLLLGLRCCHLPPMQSASAEVANLNSNPGQMKADWLQDLYAKICGVSYIGDVRMGFAEDSKKTERIARGSSEGLALMYNKRLQVQHHIWSTSAPVGGCMF